MPGLAGSMTGTAPPGRPRPTPDAPGERLAALLAEAVPEPSVRDAPAAGSQAPGARTSEGQQPGPGSSPVAGPAHRWESAARTRVPSSLLLLAVVGLAVLAWFQLGPGAGPAPEASGGAVLAEVATTDASRGPGGAPGPAPASPAGAVGTAPVPPPGGSPPAPRHPGASPSPGQRLALHVTGEVARPGVVHVDPGSRVVDAVEAAGGLTEHAATAAVNLAAPVADGQQVVVPDVRGAPGTAPGGAGVPGAPAVPGADGAGGLVNLNTAAAADLETLPRVGPVLAGRIIEFRDQHGGFASVADLDAVPGIGPALMDALAPLVTV